MIRLSKWLLAALMLGALSMGFAQDRPSGVVCIAPAVPGGSWDFTCRSVGELLRYGAGHRTNDLAFES